MGVFDFFDDLVCDVKTNVGIFVEDVKATGRMSSSTFKDIAEIPNNLANDTKVLTHELVRDEKAILREIVEDKAYDVNPTFGDALETLHTAEDAVFEKIKNLRYTIENPNSKAKKTPVKREDLSIGDHIYISRSVYTHHGIYRGDEEVIHYAPDELSDICIHIVSLDEFSDGQQLYRKNKSESPTRYNGHEIVERAEQRLTEESYNLLFNNCEHFARWCRFGDED